MKLKAIAAILLFSLTATSTQAETKTPDLAKLVEQYFTAFNKHDVAAIMNMYATDATMEHPESKTPAKGQAAIHKHYEEMFAMIPDVKDHVKTTIIQGNKAAIEFTSRGTLPGEKPRAKGKSFDLPIAAIVEFKDGKIVRDATYYDTAATK